VGSPASGHQANVRAFNHEHGDRTSRLIATSTKPATFAKINKPILFVSLVCFALLRDTP
jgi:hypothetical protein